MDDDLDSLGLRTIQELKKPSEENGNQTSIHTKLKELSSQGEHSKKKTKRQKFEGQDTLAMI